LIKPLTCVGTARGFGRSKPAGANPDEEVAKLWYGLSWAQATRDGIAD
jgi:hypothetical protein